MKVLPKLNLNKHPEEVENGSLINAVNVIVSKDNAVLQTEPILINTNVNTQLEELLGNVTYNILYCIPCNEELVLFIHKETNLHNLEIYRYNEKENKTKYCTNVEYDGGNIIGTFTYNFNNLIIAFSEYFEDDSEKIPLRTINLGNFKNGINIEDNKQLTNTAFHSICPEVKIPTVNTNYIYSNTYKGWYFIFIRYKISNNTYTQWFNTNKIVLVDIAEEQYIERYSLAYTNNYDTSEKLIKENAYSTATVSDKVSNDTDISNVSIECTVENLDNNYSQYQLGFIISSKSYTKAYRSGDINIDNNVFAVIKNNIIEDSAKELINTYENYYNVKTLVNNNNRLYVANYEEDGFDIIKDIHTDFHFTFNCSSPHKAPGSNEDNNLYNGVVNRNIWCIDNETQYEIPAEVHINDNKISEIIIPFFNLKYFSATVNHSYKKFENLSHFGINDSNGTVTIKYTNAQQQIVYYDAKISDIIYNPLINTISGELVARYSIKNYGNLGLSMYIDKIEIVKYNGNSLKYGDTNIESIIPTTSDNIRWIAPNIEDLITPSNPDTPDNPDIENPSENINNSSDINSLYIIDCTNLLPDETYAFYIHFVNKYGKVSRGYNLKQFGNVTASNFTNINNISSFKNNPVVKYNNNNNCLITIPTPVYNKYGGSIDAYVEFTLNTQNTNSLNGYGWFISYEKLEKKNVYKGIIIAGNEISFGSTSSKETKDYRFYSDCINYEDTLKFDFNKVNIIPALPFKSEKNTDFNKTVYFDGSEDGKIYNILTKNLFVADSFNNINNASNIKIKINDTIESSTGFNIAYLQNTNAGKYENINKILIPCTNIKYINQTTQISDVINTNTSFNSTIHSICFNNVMYNNVQNAFSKQAGFFGTLDQSTKNILQAFVNYKFNDYIDIPVECLRFNNKPAVKFFPVGGLNTTDENKKSFVRGFIVEAKDSIDLFKMPYMPIGDCYVKPLDYYNKNANIVNNFPKTIRRSNPYQDESTTNKWRQFEVEQYKNINENKGYIIKLISIGYYFIAHTQHSMFLFNGTDTINAEENNIQLKSVDIWDINYKEVATSDLGYAGIQKEYSGIVGEFGYIFYDSDAKRFYRYDNAQITFIDSNIVNFIKKLNGYNVHFINDKQRDRLLITLFKNNNNDIVLSYNYKINNFVSRHDYNFYRGFNTKENTYIFTKPVTNYGNNNIYNYSNTNFRYSNISIMINTEYFRMKYLEYLLYKIHKVTPKLINDYSPVENKSVYYAGDKLRVYSEFCDTGSLNITFENPESTINNFMDYAKPYWRYGNWHFNALRNKLKQLLEDGAKADECSRVFGNWFVVNIVIEQNEQVEVEGIDCKFENAELI